MAYLNMAFPWCATSYVYEIVILLYITLCSCTWGSSLADIKHSDSNEFNVVQTKG